MKAIEKYKDSHKLARKPRCSYGEHLKKPTVHRMDSRSSDRKLAICLGP